MTEFILGLNQNVVNTSIKGLYALAVLGMLFFLYVLRIGKEKHYIHGIFGFGGVITCLLTASLFWSVSDFTVGEYSRNQLGNLFIDHFEDVKSLKNNNIGTVSLNGQPVMLGTVDCKSKSFKQCVDEIKAHKDEVVSSLSSEKNYVVN